MPFCQALIGILIETLILKTCIYFNPIRPTAQHHMRSLGRRGQGSIDRGGEGVYKLWPVGIIHPQRGGTVFTKMPFTAALLAIDNRTVNGDMLFSANVKGFAIAAEVNRISANARCFTANGAVAAVEGIGVVRLHAKRNCLAMA